MNTAFYYCRKAVEILPLNTCIRIFKRTSILIFLLLSTELVGAASLCTGYFSFYLKNYNQLSETVYQRLLIIDSWTGKPKSVYFSKKNELPDRLSSYQHIAEVRFTYEMLNDPLSFKFFIRDVMSDANDSLSLWGSKREALIAQLEIILIEEGFNFVSEGRLLVSNQFYEHIKQRSIVREGPDLANNAHGRDSHLIQLAYIATRFRRAYGRGAFLAFYKYMGKEYVIWAELFDSPGTDHLGNPSIIKSVVSETIGLE